MKIFKLDFHMNTVSKIDINCEILTIKINMIYINILNAYSALTACMGSVWGKYYKLVFGSCEFDSETALASTCRFAFLFLLN